MSMFSRNQIWDCLNESKRHLASIGLKNRGHLSRRQFRYIFDNADRVPSEKEDIYYVYVLAGLYGWVRTDDDVAEVVERVVRGCLVGFAPRWEGTIAKL